ncbi:MAG: HEAT repeat domain-containing protein, partial [Bacteroidota bacterium]|nr:HEAT repeat domain-containing protein [Bacteroidota bacterium]
MKHIKITIVTLLALLLLSIPLTAQDKRTLDTKVADLLVQVPASDQQKLNEQMQAMLSLEEAGLQLVLDLVIPPGTGDDTKARVAIESLSRYLSQSGMEMQQIRWEAMILEEIEKREDPFVQSFFISQLNYFGSEAAVESLSDYLTDPKLQDPTIRAIRDIDPDEAAELFVNQLDKCEGRAQIALINAIRETGNSSHAEAVAELAGSSSPELQRSVLACLETLGNPESHGLLSSAAKKTRYLPEPTRATGSLILYAQTLSEHNNQDLSLRICKSLLRKCTAPEQVHFRSAALITAAEGESLEKSVSMLVDAMKEENKVYRMTAIRYAAENNTPVDPWISALKSSKSNDVKAEILSLFGMLHSKETVDVVKSYLANPDPGVRQQAVLSLALIKHSEAIPDILKYTLSYPAEPDSETAKAALLQTLTLDQLPLLTAALDEAPEGAKVVLIEVIAAKGDPGSFDTLFSLTEQAGAVRTASLKNLHMVSDQGDLGDLMRLFDQLEDKDEMTYVETALIAAINRGPHKEVSTQA